MPPYFIRNYLVARTVFHFSTHSLMLENKDVTKKPIPFDHTTCTSRWLPLHVIDYFSVSSFSHTTTLELCLTMVYGLDFTLCPAY